ncbi:MAG: Holliday junction branch migration protein RuvA [Blautia sp.]|nr:Holliday junction branch migration protein RuvA [Blautia sp.]
MICFVQGKVIDLTENTAVVLVHGLGLEIWMMPADLSRQAVGEEVKLHTYFQVREDAMQLFGFLNKDDLTVFKLLLNVNGVGPKAAMGILGGISSNDLRRAVMADDVKALSAAPGVGKKTAQKLILELKDKFHALEPSVLSMESQIPYVDMPGNTGSIGEAVAALTALGYYQAEAAKAIQKVDGAAEMNVEELLRAALKNL